MPIPQVFDRVGGLGVVDPVANIRACRLRAAWMPWCPISGRLLGRNRGSLTFSSFWVLCLESRVSLGPAGRLVPRVVVGLAQEPRNGGLDNLITLPALQGWCGGLVRGVWPSWAAVARVRQSFAQLAHTFRRKVRVAAARVRRGSA